MHVCQYSCKDKNSQILGAQATLEKLILALKEKKNVSVISRFDSLTNNRLIQVLEMSREEAELFLKESFEDIHSDVPTIYSIVMKHNNVSKDRDESATDHKTWTITKSFKLKTNEY